jgi:dTMP kinase
MADRDIAALEQFVLQGLKPDLTILLDAPAEISAARCGARGVSDRFEVEEAEFFARVREKYRQRATDEPARIALIDASGSLAEVQAKIATVLSERL